MPCAGIRMAPWQANYIKKTSWYITNQILIVFCFKTIPVNETKDKHFYFVKFCSTLSSFNFKQKSPVFGTHIGNFWPVVALPNAVVKAFFKIHLNWLFVEALFHKLTDVLARNIFNIDQSCEARSGWIEAKTLVNKA